MNGGRREQTDRRVLWTLFVYELKMLARDRRTIFIAIIAPLLLFPVLFLVLRMVDRNEQRRLDETVYTYALTGSEEAWARGVLAEALADGPAGGNLFEERPVENPDRFLLEGRIHLVVEAMSPAELDEYLAERDREGEAPEEEREPSEVPGLVIHFRGQSGLSNAASAELRDRIGEVRDDRRVAAFRTGGFPVPPDRVAEVNAVRRHLVPERRGGSLIGLFTMPVLLFLMLSGGSIIAADAIAGEKERGTLETLLTTSASRTDIVSAKQLAIIVVGLVVVLINVGNLLAYFVLGLVPLPQEAALALAPLDLILLLLLFTPLAVLVSSALLLLSGFAKTYREFQVYFFPVMLVFLVPSLLAILPGMQLRSAIAFVPLAGIGVAVREVMLAEYDVLFLFIAFLSTSAAALALSRLTSRSLSVEKLISQSDLDEADLVGGPALFPRHVLRWFLGLWVLFFVVSLWFGETLGLRGQVFVNLVVIFFGGSLVMVRRYRLPVREAFALRAVPATVWLAVLIGAPSAYITGVGLGEFVNAFVFPIPDEVLEAFGQVILADDLPLWQLLIFLSIMPGVFEQLTFRGVLLYGLRRLHPVAICLIVGAIFGLFHVSLFRILPTAYLGVILAALTLMTGSVLPAIVWHALNNAIALVPDRLGWVEEGAVISPEWYPIAAVGLALAFAIVWRVRRPYPGRARPHSGRVELVAG